MAFSQTVGLHLDSVDTTNLREETGCKEDERNIHRSKETWIYHQKSKPKNKHAHKCIYVPWK